MSLSDGTRFGAYEITGQIGAGGMGEVYRATDTKLGREVAIKTLPAALASDKDRLARFEREAKLLAALNHPHIASVYSLDEHEGTLYLTMELVEGETLEEKLKPGALPVEDALRLALQIAEALEAAHEKGVVHRDLKPANVMVSANGQVKVLDFGLAKAFSNEPEEASPGRSPALSLAMTQQGIILGTAGYMSPEQASGQATDQRADIWAFGVVLYEMLTGLPLFSGESVPHILADVLKTEPDWNRLPQNLHPLVTHTLERCLTKKPRNRYHSMADVRVDLEESLNDPDGAIGRRGLVEAGAATAAPLTRRLLPWAAALALAMLAGITAWSLRTPEARPLVRSIHGLPDDRSMVNGIVAAIDIAPSGEYFVYGSNDGLYLRRMDSFSDVPISGTEGITGSPVFSPDSQSIAYLSAQIGIERSIVITRIPVTGGTPIPLVRLGATIPNGISWAPNGTILYAMADGIWRIAENGGEAEKLIEANANERLVGPQLLPGGDWVLFTLGRGTAPFDWDAAEIVAQSLSSGERRLLRAGGSSGRFISTGHLAYAFGDTLFAAPLDLDALELTGPSVQVTLDVRRENLSGIAQYAYSSDGTLIYVPSVVVDSNARTLTIFDRDGRAEPLPVPAGEYADARVSPDGRWVAYTATYADGTDVALYEIGADTAPRRLTFGGQTRFPAWSADGSRVAYQSMRDGTASVYWQLADGTTAPERLTTAEEGETHTPDSFSSDGEHLSYTVQIQRESAIWSLDLESLDTEAIVQEPGQQISASVFSPGGAWIAYQSTESPPVEVFVQPYPPTGAKFQLPEAAENHHPAWSGDGTELFYIASIESFGSVRISTQPNFSFGAPMRLANNGLNAPPSNHRQFDVMPDGSGFIGAARGALREGDRGEEIRIVENWFEELNRLVPTR